jgi:hypothetical protein
MKSKSETHFGRPEAHSAEEELDELNARTAAQPEAQQAIRHAMEAQIEDKTRQRRGHEEAASSAWKK